MRRPLLALVLLSFAPLLCAQVYKWKDASGTMHYSETPPPTGTKYSRVSMSGLTDPSGPSQAAPAPAATAAQPAQAAANSQADAASTQKACSDLQHNMSQLQGSGAVSTDDGKGHTTAMSPAQRQQELAKEQSQYQQYCLK